MKLPILLTKMRGTGSSIHYMDEIMPVVPRKAVAEVSKIGNV
jgi:hypothetical protein